MTRKVRYQGDVDCGPSPAIFGDLGYLRGLADLGQVMLLDDDFVRPSTYASATSQNGDYTYQDTNVTIAGKGSADSTAPNDVDKELGVLDIDVLDTDNDEGSIQFGGSNQWRLDDTSGNTTQVGYEVRLSVDEVGTNMTGIMAGFVEGPLATAHAVDDTGAAVAAKAVCCFRTLAATPTEIDIVYQNTATSGVTELSGNAATLVGNTYTKLGLLFDPYEVDTTKAITFFKDGVAIAYANTTQVAGANFPLGEGMVPFVLGKTYGSGTSGTVSIDRVTAFQAFNNIQV